MRVIVGLYRLKRLLKGGGAVRNLTVRQNAARLDRIPVTDLPWSDPDLLRQQVDERLER